MSEPRRLAIESAGEAQRVFANVGVVMERLLKLVEEETALVRAGHLHQALTFEATKAELAGHYLSETERLKASRAFIERALPGAFAALQKQHQGFQALLQTNLTVLATAHAVSENIIRGVSEELARKRAPQTYGATGRPAALSPRAGQPLAVSRAL